MKKMKARSAGFLALALACSGMLAMAAPVEAQTRVERRRLTNVSYERMRQWVRELEQLATRANREAQADQAGYRGFRRDSNFLRSIDNFSRRVSQFRARMDTYRTRPWNVDDEIGRLLRDAQNVQNRIERARFVDASTRRDWNQVIVLLHRLNDEYLGRDSRDDRYADERYRRDDDYRRDDGRYDDGRYSDSVDTANLRRLARDLDESATRVAQLSDRYGSGYGYSSEMRRFSEEARDFRQLVENRTFSRSELRSHVNRLLEEAQDAHSEMSRTRVASDVASEWSRVVQVLDRMRDLVV
jgi:hypothetical protein